MSQLLQVFGHKPTDLLLDYGWIEYIFILWGILKCECGGDPSNIKTFHSKPEMST